MSVFTYQMIYPILSLILPMTVLQVCQAHEAKPIVDVRFDSSYNQVEPSMGDKWALTWASDDLLYVVSGDGSGFGSVLNTIVLGKLQGSDPNKLQGAVVNPMSEYEDMTQLGSAGASWRATSPYSVNGTLYMFVTCRILPTRLCGLNLNESDPLTQKIAFVNSSLISSRDNGKTWTRTAEENYRQPMFAGQRFGAPFFVWYGKDGKASADNADRYVYAISNNGYFANGDGYVLGRVLKNRLPALNPTDWSFYRGGDGMKDDSWSVHLDDADSILTNPGRSSITGVTYIGAFRRYLMINWHYANPGKDFSTTLEFFEAPKPWGPWTIFKTFRTGQLGWYVPIVGQKFQTKATANIVRAVLYTTGTPINRELLKLNFIPITLSTEPLQHRDTNFVGGK